MGCNKSIEKKVSLPQNFLRKIYLRQFFHTGSSGCCLHHTNEPKSTLLHLTKCLHRSKVDVCTYNTPLFIYPWLKNIYHYRCIMQQTIIFFRRMEIFFRLSLDTVLHSSSRLQNSKRVANVTTHWDRNASDMSINGILPRLRISKFVLSKKEANIFYHTSLTRHQTWKSKNQS